jgi:para-nitrobenzyl esterase
MPQVTTLHTPSGPIRGNTRLDGGREFLGIRYATAQRHRAPEDITPSVETIDATQFGPLCPQIPGALEIILGADTSNISEDCLHLNVFTPAAPSSQASLPVLVWIHGGAYTNGSNSVPIYHGSSLASRGAVVVAINYRLGSFGFLGENNFGILDMISALRWVQRNIAAFDGDINNVTIFGESAGGSAIVSLMSSPEAKGLFHKAWAMSPSIGQLRTKERAVQAEQVFLEHAGVSTREDLQSFTISEMLSVQAKLEAIPTDNFDFFTPAADGSTLPHDILTAAAESPLPFVVGTNRDENRLWAALDPAQNQLGEEHWNDLCTQTFGDHAARAKSTYEQIRPEEVPWQLISSVHTDTAFRQRAQRISEQRIDANNKTWMYWFTWPTPVLDGIVGSCHGLDVPFAFDNLSLPGTDGLTGDSPDRAAIAARFADEIVHFAINSQPTWPAFDTTNRMTLEINAEFVILSDPEKEIREIFLSL